MHGVRSSKSKSRMCCELCWGVNARITQPKSLICRGLYWVCNVRITQPKSLICHGLYWVCNVRITQPKSLICRGLCWVRNVQYAANLHGALNLKATLSHIKHLLRKRDWFNQIPLFFDQSTALPWGIGLV
jgi:hypothetical protein